MEEYQELLKRLVRGAEFIEGLRVGDRRLKPAQRKYDSLSAMVDDERERVKNKWRQ